MVIEFEFSNIASYFVRFLPSETMENYRKVHAGVLTDEGEMIVLKTFNRNQTPTQQTDDITIVS